MEDAHSDIKPVARLRVSDSVAAQLTQLILNNVYKVGERLPPERILSEQFAVSRSSMREAIRSVEAVGLVNSSHGVGVFVISNTLEMIATPDLLVFEEFKVSDLFELRRTLEGDSAAFAAKRIAPDDETELKQILQECSNAGITDADFVKLDIKFHQAITRAAKNPLLSQVYGTLEPLLLDYSARVITLPGRRDVAHEGHTRILNAILSRQVREARKAALSHIADVEHDISKFQAPDWLRAL